MKASFDYFPGTAHHILCYSIFNWYHPALGSAMLQSSHFTLILLDVGHCLLLYGSCEAHKKRFVIVIAMRCLFFFALYLY